MKRRTVLGGTCAFAAVALAGCLGDEDSSGKTDEAKFEVTALEIGPAASGDMRIEYEVTNTGNSSDTQELRISAGGFDWLRPEVSLQPGETYTDSVTHGGHHSTSRESRIVVRTDDHRAIKKIHERPFVRWGE